MQKWELLDEDGVVCAQYHCHCLRFDNGHILINYKNGIHWEFDEVVKLKAGQRLVKMEG